MEVPTIRTSPVIFFLLLKEKEHTTQKIKIRKTYFFIDFLNLNFTHIHNILHYLYITRKKICYIYSKNKILII